MIDDGGALREDEGEHLGERHHLDRTRELSTRAGAALLTSRGRASALCSTHARG
jgi:hypothetical protein